MGDYDWRTAKGVGVINRGLYKIIAQYLLEETDETHRKISIRIISLPTDMRNLK